jgi:hypothetical protein
MPTPQVLPEPPRPAPAPDEKSKKTLRFNAEDVSAEAARQKGSPPSRTPDDWQVAALGNEAKPRAVQAADKDEVDVVDADEDWIVSGPER